MSEGRRADRREEGLKREWETRRLVNRGPTPRTLPLNSLNLQPPPPTLGCAVFYYHPCPPFWVNVTDKDTKPHVFSSFPPARGGAVRNLAGSGDGTLRPLCPSIGWEKEEEKRTGRLNSSEVTLRPSGSGSASYRDLVLFKPDRF